MKENEPPGGVCDYCGLPLPRGWFRKSAGRAHASASPQYCCLGCRFAAEVAAERGSTRLDRPMIRLGLSVFLAMNIMAFSMALWTSDVYETAGQPGGHLSPPLAAVLRYLTLLLTLPVAWMLGLPLAIQTAQQIRRGVLSTDLLLVTGVLAALGYSIVSVVRGNGALYFEVAAVVLVMVTLGRWLESAGKLQATAALDSLAKLLPRQARRLPAGDADEYVPLEKIVHGDRLRVAAGERVPADGRIVAGETLVDEQLLTGESRPIAKVIGDDVRGGTLNLDGELIVEVTAASGQGTLARLIDTVRRARFAKGRYQQLADRVSSAFLPAVLLIAIATFIWWTRHAGIERGVLAVLAVVLIACPCALGLATPLAVWSALGRASRAQVLFRGGDALERLAKVRAVFFDKTGTLTDGRPRVARLIVADESGRAQTLARAVALAQGITHPLSVAVVELGRSEAATAGSLGQLPSIRSIRALPGLGIIGRLSDDDQVCLGSARLLRLEGFRIPERLEAQLARQLEAGLSVSLVGWRGEARGLLVFEEQMRPEAVEALAELRRRGLHVEVFTGDHANRAARLEAELGISVTGEMLPNDKLEALKCAKQEFGLVAMVGDGINDAPALAAADVGIAMGCGADVSRDSADVCLLGNDLGRIAWAIDLAGRIVSIIRQNLFWAMIYNVLGIGLACEGLLNPIWASLAMVVSSSLVIANSLRLGREASVGNGLRAAAEPATDRDVIGALGTARSPFPPSSIDACVQSN